VETLYTKDGQPARPGERAYRKTPDGRMVLQSQTINQQVEMVQNWRTPSSSDGEGGVMEMREGCAGKYKLRDHVVAEQKQWATPKASDPQHSGPNMRDSAGNYALPAQAVRAQWATPRAGKTTDENPETWAARQAKGDVATMPLTAQVKAWATPIMGDSHLASTPEQIAAMRAKGHGVKNLNEQACWGTPTARDHKSGRGNEEREYKELTPMVERKQAGKLNPRWVETLMGLPVGWVMPSCKSPVTIEPTNSGSLAMESCLPPQSELLESSGRKS
jgi:hypothetical protein